jgi:ABC-2 type transport system permease protein
MRLFAEEFKSGTYELLQTRPLTKWQILSGKYFGALFIVFIALLPTAIYLFAVKSMGTDSGVDGGAIAGSYIGLFFLAAVFAAIGLLCSSLTANAVAAFLISVLMCLLVYFFFTAISRMPFLKGGADYYIESLGLDFHYRSISRGVVDTRDLVYFFTAIVLFLGLTFKNLEKR